MNEEISYTFRGEDGTRIRVTAEPALGHANICRYIVEPDLYPAGGVHFVRGANISESPLAGRLFGLREITELVIAGNSVTVTLDQPANWNEFSEVVAGAIRDQINSGVPSVSDTFTEKLPAPEVLREKVQEVLDDEINPAVAAHGGVVNILDVRANNVFLEFGGGCQGCGMVSVTLKYGVEKRLREKVPDIGQILDTTDHAAGTNPFYAPAAK